MPKFVLISLFCLIEQNKGLMVSVILLTENFFMLLSSADFMECKQLEP